MSRLASQEVVFTGRLAALTHEEAAAGVVAQGGTVSGVVGPGTTLVVVGQEGWPLQRDGRLTRNLKLARERAEQGQALRIVDEQAFLALLGPDAVPDPPTNLYSITQLSRVLAVPAARVRSWVRRGLIAPAEVRDRVAYFDFRTVATARHLQELVGGGASLNAIAASLAQLRQWLPDAGDAVGRLTPLDGNSLAVRLSDGSLASVSGQMRLPETAPAPRVIHIDTALTGEPETAEGWFERAVALEEAERPDEAAHAYLRCLELGGQDAEAAFNLGNVLHSLGRPTQALRHYYQATDWDPDFAEAWVNLSSVLVEMAAWKDAAESARMALRISPGYADAHYNLALALHGLGQERDARLHARAYLLQDPSSEWASLLRRQLGLA
jgi:tetratricopeptide (TPR) repeat protein